MILNNFYKLSVWIFGTKYDYYGSMTEYLDFNKKLKHEIIWKKPEQKSNVKDVVEQQQLF